MSPIPNLLYHHPSLTPHPANTSSSLLTIRFPSPIRITSLRITPEGVTGLTGPGYVWSNATPLTESTTYPAEWVGKVYLNVSPGTPVNALASTEIRVWAAGFALDYPIEMPEGVTTRMVILQAPVERVTLSIYGFTTPDPSSTLPVEEVLPIPIEKEAWTWLSSWAGGVQHLLDLLNDDTSRQIRQSALDSLDLLADIQPILQSIVEHATALPFLLSLPSYPVQPLLQRLLTEPTYALHRNLRYHLPHSHPLKRLVSGGREAAWRNLDLGKGALMIIAEGTGDDLLDVSKGEDRSNLTRLVEHAQALAKGDDDESRKCLELALDTLNKEQLHSDAIASGYVARTLPPLAVISRTRGSDRTLEIPAKNARVVTKGLLRCSTGLVDGRSCWGAASELARPHLEHLAPDDPLRTAWTAGLRGIPSPSFADTVDGRRLSRLSQAISDAAPHPPFPPSQHIPNPDNEQSKPACATPNAIEHLITPSSLLLLLAPHLHHSLSTTPLPPLGIPSTIHPTPESQASTWAGKVYSSHEFRDRERDREREGMGVGLGIGGGLGPGLVGVSGGGAGTRPASRHVDEYGF